MANTWEEQRLAQAIVDGNLPIVKMLVEKGVNCRGPWCSCPRLNPNRDTFLHVAVGTRKPDIVKYLIEKGGVDVNERSGRGYTALHGAVVCGFYEIVKLLVELKANCNAIEESGSSPCHFAAKEGLSKIMQFLVKHGKADINKRNKIGVTPFIAAASHVKDINFLKLLIDLGANVTARDNNGFPALHHAGVLGNVNTLKFLIEGGYLNPNDCNKDGRNLLHVLLIQQDQKKEAVNEKAIEYLVKSGKMDLNKAIEGRTTALHLAVQNLGRGSAERIVQALIEAGADYKICPTDGQTLLHRAAMFGKEMTFRYLCEEAKVQLDIHGRNSDGQTPLHLACMSNSLCTVVLLLNNGADLKAVAHDGRGCLHFAAPFGATCVITYLMKEKKIEAGDVNKGTKDGVTPLHSAAKYGHLELCKLYVDLGADHLARDHSGSSVLHYAAKEGHAEVLEYFVKKLKINVNECRNENGVTPLHVACESGSHADCVKVLVENGADCSLLDGKGRSCLRYAAKAADGKVCRYLIREAKLDVNDSKFGITPTEMSAIRNHLASNDLNDCKVS